MKTWAAKSSVKGQARLCRHFVPYYWPGEASPVSYRIRRDQPDMVQKKDGALKEDRKYLERPAAESSLYPSRRYAGKPH